MPVQKWRVLAISLVLLILICLATIAVSGKQPFATFIREIGPTLGRPSEGIRNVTAHSFLFKLYGRDRVPRAAEGIVQAGELVLIALGAGGLLRSLKGLSEDTAKLLAACSAPLKSDHRNGDLL
jgi:hypothetical protein